MIKQIACFQTEDGKTHATRLEALRWEYNLALRGIIQSDPRLPKNPTAGDVIFAMARNDDVIANTIRSYQKKIRGCEQAAQ